IDGLSAERCDELRDLAAVVPRMAEYLRQDALHVPAIAFAVAQLPLELPCELDLIEAGKILPPSRFRIRDELRQFLKTYVLRERAGGVRPVAQAIEPALPRRREMGHPADRLLKLRRRPPRRRHRRQHRQRLGVAVALVFVPMTETVCESLHAASDSRADVSMR